MKKQQGMLGRVAGFLAACLVAASPAAVQAQQKTEDNLARIVQSKVVRVGAIEAYPYYRKDLKTNSWIGIVPETMELLFGAIGVKVEYVPTDWGTAIAGLQSGKFDLVGAYNATPQRALAVDFTRPLAESRVGVLTLREPDAKYERWESLNTPEFRIAAADGASTTKVGQRLLPNATWVLVKSSDAMFMELESGRVEAVLSNHPTLTLYRQNKKAGTMVIPKHVVASPVNIALRKGNPELQQWLNVAMQFYEVDGSLAQIWNKYLPEQ